MNNPDSKGLLDLAASILDGTDVDWSDAEERTPTNDRALVQSLKLLSKISELHRTDPTTSWGPFELRQRIGRGSHGDVHVGWDSRLHREVALKLLRPSLELVPDAADPGSTPTESSFVTYESDAEGPGLRERWLAEARRLAAVSHPNLVSIHTAEEFDGVAGIAMELVRGQTLEARLQSEGVAGASELATLGMDLCRAVAALHQVGLLHHDIKASNVIREEGGRIVLMDLGVGGATPLYMAPELLRGERATRATDIYALGVLLHQLASDSFPVRGATLDELRAAHDAGSRSSLRDARPDLPGALVRVIERAHAADAAARFQSAGQLEEALAQTLSGSLRSEDPSGASESSTIDPSHLKRQWRPSSPWFAASAVAAVALIAFALLRSNGPGRPGRPSSQEHGSKSPPTGTFTEAGLTSGGSFSIRASFHRGMARSPVNQGDRVTLGDSLALEVEASESLFVYVLNEDARGQSFLLFPLRGFEPENPLPPELPHQLPGSREGRRFYWQVTSVGEEERLILLASRRRLVGFEADALSIDRAREGREVAYPRVSDRAWEELRGLGGLVGERTTTGGGAHLDFFAEAAALGGGWQESEGVFVRKLELSNPSPR